MTNVEDENITNLKEDGAWIAEKYDEELNTFIKLLLK